MNHKFLVPHEIQQTIRIPLSIMVQGLKGLSSHPVVPSTGPFYPWLVLYPHQNPTETSNQPWVPRVKLRVNIIHPNIQLRSTTPCRRVMSDPSPLIFHTITSSSLQDEFSSLPSVHGTEVTKAYLTSKGFHGGNLHSLLSFSWTSSLSSSSFPFVHGSPWRVAKVKKERVQDSKGWMTGSAVSVSRLEFPIITSGGSGVSSFGVGIIMGNGGYGVQENEKNGTVHF